MNEPVDRTQGNPSLVARLWSLRWWWLGPILVLLALLLLLAVTAGEGPLAPFVYKVL